MSRNTVRETLGFVGVIVSLIFVGLEIHQNTLASRAAAMQESTNVVRQQVRMFVTVSFNAQWISVAPRDPYTLSPPTLRSTATPRIVSERV